MLMGLLAPTSGTARIAGHDLVHDIDAIYRVMGVCPQFDVLWDELTGREHLRFYGRYVFLGGGGGNRGVSWCVMMYVQSMCMFWFYT